MKPLHAFTSRMPRHPVCICTGMWLEPYDGIVFRGDLFLYRDILVCRFNERSDTGREELFPDDRLLSAPNLGMVREGTFILSMQDSIGASISPSLATYVQEYLHETPPVPSND